MLESIRKKRKERNKFRLYYSVPIPNLPPSKVGIPEYSIKHIEEEGKYKLFSLFFIIINY